MKVSHTYELLESPAMQRLGQFVREHDRLWQNTTPGFEQFERDLHKQMVELEQELLAAELARYDVDAQQIEVEGVRYHPVWVDTETYLTAAGEVQVERHLYRPRAQRQKYLSAGIASGYRGWLLDAACCSARCLGDRPVDARRRRISVWRIGCHVALAQYAGSPAARIVAPLGNQTRKLGSGFARPRNGARGCGQRGILVGWRDGADES